MLRDRVVIQGERSDQVTYAYEDETTTKLTDLTPEEIRHFLYRLVDLANCLQHFGERLISFHPDNFGVAFGPKIFLRDVYKHETDEDFLSPEERERNDGEEDVNLENAYPYKIGLLMQNLIEKYLESHELTED